MRGSGSEEPVVRSQRLPKQKTHKGAAKRFKVSGGGKVVRQHSMHAHILTKKTAKRKRKLRQSTTAEGKLAKSVRQMLHN